MKRDLQQLSAKQYDVIIIGGGIYGAWAAWDAALRGLSVALVEKDDFGGATSSNSLKIIHGGLRYLQHADFKRMRESIHERKVLMHVAPHLVHPLPCIMPTYGHGIKGREVMSIALWLNDLVGFDRNRLPDPQKRLPAGRIVSKEELLRRLPGIEETGLTGGAVWYDCQIYNSERLLLSLLHGAVAHGAQMANYAPVIGLLREGNSIRGVQVRDAMSGDCHEIKGRLVLNSSGPWINSLFAMTASEHRLPEIQFSKALNLVINRKPAGNYAAGIPSKHTFRDQHAVVNRGSRLLFVAPWRRYMLLGTDHVPYSGAADDFKLTETDVRQLLDEYNEAYPAQKISPEEITYWYGGLLPMEPLSNGSKDVTLTKQYKIFDHEKIQQLQGLVSILGVKYTTARDVAAKAIDLVCKKLRHRGKSTTAHRRVPGGEIERFAEYLDDEIAKRPWGLDREVIRHLIYNYGRNYPMILLSLEEHAATAKRVDPAQEVIEAEVIHAAKEEMAVTLLDVVRRRTVLGSAGCPSKRVLRRTATIMAKYTGWDTEQIAAEIARTQAYYRLHADRPGAMQQSAANAPSRATAVVP